MSESPPARVSAAARASVTAVVGVLAAVGLMLLLVTWAATIGPQAVITKEDRPPSHEPVSPSTSATQPPLGGNQASEGGGDHDVLFTVVAIAATLLAAVLVLAVLLTALHWLLTRDWRRRREPEPVEVDFDLLDAPAALAGSMVAGARVQRQLLDTGSARNAIVACWHRFEEQAEAAGVRKQPWETSSEFTMRVLDRLAADDSAVLRLAELYRDARYSAHEVTEDDRRAAAEALDAIHRSLGATAGSP